jgi:signal transduction histidine kinase
MSARQQVARQLDVYEDRDRIARDLHDHVIQRLFAAGLSLQAAATRVHDAAVQDRLRGVVDQLDQTVRDIRTTIFDLHTADGAGHGDSLRRRVLDIVTAAAGADLHPTVRMSGAIDNLVTGALAADVEAVVREGVTNAARHAAAEHVTITLDVGDEVVVEVLDDGRGIDATIARSGLGNLERRALARDGAASVQQVPDGGTRLRWHVPLPPNRDQ